MMTAASSASTPPPGTAPAWDAALRDHLINRCKAPANQAEEVVDLIRHAREQVQDRLLEIAGNGRNDWVRSMALANAAELIKADLDEITEAVRSMETASGRLMQSTALHVAI